MSTTVYIEMRKWPSWKRAKSRAMSWVNAWSRDGCTRLLLRNFPFTGASVSSVCWGISRMSTKEAGTRHSSIRSASLMPKRGCSISGASCWSAKITWKLIGGTGRIMSVSYSKYRNMNRFSGITATKWRENYCRLLRTSS